MNNVVIINSNHSEKFQIDSKFEKEVSDSIERHNRNGYKVVTITPITGSESYYSENKKESYGYGHGFTIGVIIVFEKVNEG